MGVLKSVINGVVDFFRILVGGLVGAVLGIFGVKGGPSLTPEPFKTEQSAEPVAKVEPPPDIKPALKPAELPKPVTVQAPKPEPKPEPVKVEAPKPVPVKAEPVKPAEPVARFDPAAIPAPRPNRRPGPGLDYFRDLARQVRS